MHEPRYSISPVSFVDYGSKTYDYGRAIQGFALILVASTKPGRKEDRSSLVL